MAPPSLFCDACEASGLRLYLETRLVRTQVKQRARVCDQVPAVSPRVLLTCPSPQHPPKGPCFQELVEEERGGCTVLGERHRQTLAAPLILLDPQSPHLRNGEANLCHDVVGTEHVGSAWHVARRCSGTQS